MGLARFVSNPSLDCGCNHGVAPLSEWGSSKSAIIFSRIFYSPNRWCSFTTPPISSVSGQLLLLLSEDGAPLTRHIRAESVRGMWLRMGNWRGPLLTSKASGWFHIVGFTNAPTSDLQQFKLRLSTSVEQSDGAKGGKLSRPLTDQRNRPIGL